MLFSMSLSKVIESKGMINVKLINSSKMTKNDIRIMYKAEI